MTASHMPRWKHSLQPIAWLLIVMMGAMGMLGLAKTIHDQQRDRRAADYNNCLTGNDTRRVISDLIAIALQNNDEFDYRSIPSFANLPPEMKQYLIDLSDLQRQGQSTEAIRDYVRSQLPQRNCEPLLDGKPFTVPSAPPTTIVSTTGGTTR